MKLSERARYYIIFMVALVLYWGALTLLQFEFINIIFFLTAYIWHFALMTPGLKEQVLTKNQRYSFLSVVVRLNHYLQIFINLKRVPFASSFIRAISPALFACLLLLVGGRGNILFTFLGSFCFEVIYIVLVKRKKELFSPSEHTDGLDTPPVIPSEEKTHE